MKIIILGSNGMLGSYLNSYLRSKYELINLAREDVDFSTTNEENILQFMIYGTKCHFEKEDIIINAAGVIKQRGNYNIKDMIMVNSVLPHILAKIKEKLGCNVIHITTDCVFNGLRGAYVETDKHDCFDDYGKSKSLGENETITNIRTSLIGEEKINKKSLLEWIVSNKGKTIDGYENHLWNGVTCLELARFIDNIIKNKSFWDGVRHIFSPTTISKYGLVNMINEIYDLNITVNKKTTETNCYRNLSTIYDNNTIGTGIYEQILELKKFRQNEY